MTRSTSPATQALLGAVETAILAPSMHNSQPWRFRISEDWIEVHIDPDRLPALGDPSWRGARLACGAAVFNLRLALAVHERTPIVATIPDPTSRTLVARVAPGPRRPASPEERELFDVVARRHSNRDPFLDVPVPLEHRARLRAAAQRETAWLDFLLGPAAIDTARELVRAADNRLIADPAYRAEIAAWTRYEGENASDGVPEIAGGPAPKPDELLTRRAYGSGRPSLRDYETEPVIGVLGSLSDSPADQVTAGQALQRVLLTLTAHGLVASLMSQPIEVPEVREQLRIGLGRYGPPQMMLRIGYGTPGPSAPRRPVDAVVDLID